MLAPIDLDEDQFLESAFRGAVPEYKRQCITDWAKENVRLVGSVRSESFDIETTPWLREPFEAVEDPEVDTVTLAFIAQGGKSTFGEVVIMHRVATSSGGDIQYNWENDEKGKDRFKKRVRRIFEACPPVNRLMSSQISNTRPVIVGIDGSRLCAA